MSNEPQDLHMDAAEYVIGTLSDDERAAFETRLKTDGEARDAVAFWERTLGTLSATISPAAVPESVWARIASRLTDADSSSAAPVATSANDNIEARLRRSRSRWRGATAIAAALALALGLLALNDAVRQEALPVVDRLAGIERTPSTAEAVSGRQFVAVVNANGDQPSLIVTVDADTKNVSVRSLGIEQPTGQSLELWYVPDGEEAVSVGLVGEGDIDLGPLPARGGDLLAISLEPPGGSPTGTATGPVIYTGTLVGLD